MYSCGLQTNPTIFDISQNRHSYIADDRTEYLDGRLVPHSIQSTIHNIITFNAYLYQ